MSIYPVFSIDSISNWCTKDVAEFIAQETAKNGTLKLETGFKLTTTGLDTKVACEKAIEPFVKFINDSLGGAKYVDAISTITDPTLQNKLWIARTFLFSQLMIFAVVILGKDDDYKSGKDDESLSLYTQVFGEANGKTIFPFMSLSPDDLKLYQMGIFGSKSPTSDIDVGIQYIGASTKPTLHYILSVFEQLFVTFTGKSSLDFDIEAYADLYLIRDDSGADYFYLDSGTFTQEDFVKMLPVAGLSIARNVLMDDPNALQPTFEQIVVVVNDASKSNFADRIGPELMSVLNEPKWLSEAMGKMQTFLLDTSHEKRAKYYAAVLAAETQKMALAPSVAKAANLTNTDRCELINLVGTALAYRMESYTAAPTITHVVRILQANKDAAEKYKTEKPKELCSDAKKSQNSAYCAIGKYGFIMSILEQMGYMCRFYQHYCVGDHKEEEKCNKKMKKYGDRYVDGFDKYKMHLEATITGGKRRTRRRNKNRKTSKRGKYRKGGRTRK